MTFLLQFRKATQQKKTKTKLETCARDCAELQARRVQATHGNAPRRSRQDGSKDHSPTERWTDLSMKEQLSSGQESLSKWAGDIKRG